MICSLEKVYLLILSRSLSYLFKNVFGNKEFLTKIKIKTKISKSCNLNKFLVFYYLCIHLSTTLKKFYPIFFLVQSGII